MEEQYFILSHKNLCQDHGGARQGKSDPRCLLDHPGPKHSTQNPVTNRKQNSHKGNTATQIGLNIIA
ncbi:hypothetical protein QTP70_018778, partial [Hemibagrus guttatus]